ncbi:amidase family protein [Streptomyces phaeofaciens]|uniref:amidase family protein n=1 Tax=Streptomyces phaeofaciens TaxID=68254 RepID=UPI001E2ECE14|nr:amidase family protein [Streptomyces phaeofaciens]
MRFPAACCGVVGVRSTVGRIADWAPPARRTSSSTPRRPSRTGPGCHDRGDSPPPVATCRR